MEDKKLVALTFDDGPSDVTSRVLDILEKYNIVGSFFLIGNQINEGTKQLIEREISCGCEVNNHSFTHSPMSKMDPAVIKEEIRKTTELITEITGKEPAFFRPPFIDLSDTMYESIDLPFICGVDSVDWDPKTTVEGRIENVLNKVKDGAIVLMHDLPGNTRTVEALPSIIEALRDKGYSFVTVSEIFEQKGIDPNVRGKLWSNVFE